MNERELSPTPERPYRAPEFVELGSVRELTMGQGGDSRDTGGWCIPVPLSPHTQLAP